MGSLGFFGRPAPALARHGRLGRCGRRDCRDGPAGLGAGLAGTTAANRLERWAKRGTRGYHNQCLRLADNAYQPKGNRTSTALSQWYRAKRKGYAHPGNRRPPMGAQMFWRTSNPAGHIATYVGNGKAVTNMPGGAVKKINWKKMNSWGPYLGWAEPYYG